MSAKRKSFWQLVRKRRKNSAAAEKPGQDYFEAKRTAQEVRGAGDSAISIYADSFGQDAEFFAFYRSMEAYRNSMGKDGTSMVLSPDSSFFRFFKDKEGSE